MAYWLLSALGYVALVRSERRHLRPLLAASGIAFLIYLPNLWWNWSNGFVSYLHVRDNAELSGPLFHPTAFLEFFGSQFGVFGPLFFAGLIAIVVRPRPFAAFGHDLRWAWRSMRTRPSVSLVVIASIGLAIGANTAAFSVVDAFLWRSWGSRATRPATSFRQGWRRRRRLC